MNTDCTLLELPDELLFSVFDTVTDKDLGNLLLANKELYNLVKDYLKYNNKRYKYIRLWKDPSYHNKKEKCVICKRYVKKGAKTNSPFRRTILKCCGKRYISLHYKCYNSVLMTLKCNDCGHIFKPDSFYNVSNINKISKFQYEVDMTTFIALHCANAI